MTGKQEVGNTSRLFMYSLNKHLPKSGLDFRQMSPCGQVGSVHPYSDLGPFPSPFCQMGGRSVRSPCLLSHLTIQSECRSLTRMTSDQLASWAVRGWEDVGETSDRGFQPKGFSPPLFSCQEWTEGGSASLCLSRAWEGKQGGPERPCLDPQALP